MAGQYDVFISYRRSDSDISARFIDEALEQKGIAVFRDKDELEAGTFKEQLERAIKECTAFIVLLTAYTFADRGRSEDWVLHEIQYAKDCGKIIIPVMQNGCKIDRAHFPDSIAYIAELEGVELASENWEQGVERLCELVQKAKRRQTMNAMCPHCGNVTEQVFQDDKLAVLCPKCHKPFMLLDGADVYYRKGFVVKGSTLVKYVGHAEKLKIPSPDIPITMEIDVVGKNAFSKNTALVEIDLCGKYREVFVEGSKDGYNDYTDYQYVGVRTIADEAFSNCPNLEKAVLPNEEIELGNGIFSGCSQLRSVDWNMGTQWTTEIPAGTFSGCVSLKEVYVPKNLSVIGSSAFRFCESLQQFIYETYQSWSEKTVHYGLPPTVRKIGYAAFQDCASLELPSYPSQAKIETDAFQHTVYEPVQDGLETYTDEQGLLFAESRLIKCTNRYADTITIPETVTEIAPYAFFRCDLKEIHLPACVTRIGDKAFAECRNLQKINLNEQMELGDSAFWKCSELEEPEGLTKLWEALQNRREWYSHEDYVIFLIGVFGGTKFAEEEEKRLYEEYMEAIVDYDDDDDDE